MATEVGSLYYDINIDDKKLKSSLDESDKKVKSFGDRVSNSWNTAADASKKFTIGATIATGAAVAFGVSAVKAFKESETVIAQTNAVLTSTKGIAGVTATEVDKLAKSLQYASMHTDEEVASAQNMLLTFTNIHKDVFPRTTKAVLDMAQAMGTDLTSTSIQVGKALQDPVRGVTALQRVGVRLTEEQKNLVQSLVDVGDTAGAQAIILKELETEFGGSAEAALRAAGPFAILSKIWDDMKESIGGVISKAIDPLAQKLLTLYNNAGGIEGIFTKIKDAFEKLKPYFPEIAGALIGMLLPALVGIAIALGEVLLPLLVLAAIGAAVGAIVKEIVKHFGGWDATVKKLQPTLDKLKEWFIVIKDFGVQAFNAIKNSIDDVWAAVQLLITGDFKGGIFGLAEDSGVVKALLGIHDAALMVYNIFSTVVTFIISMVTPALNLLKMAWDFLSPSLTALWNTITTQVYPAFKKLWEAVVQLWNALNPALMDAIKVIAAVLGAILLAALWVIINALNILINVFTWVVNAISTVIRWVAQLVSWIGNLIGTVINAVIAIGGWFGRLPGYVSSAINSVIDWFRQLPGRILGAVGDLSRLLYNAGAQIIQGLLSGITDGFNKVKDKLGDLTNKIKSWKGPADVDKKLLVPNAKLIMGGFIQGLESQYGLVQRSLGDFTSNIASPSFSLAGGAGNASGGGSNVVNHAGTTVNIGQINNQQDEAYVIRRLNRNSELEGIGISPVL